MADTKGISVQVPVDLHAKVKAEQEQLELTMSEYIQKVLEEHFTPKLDMKGGENMIGNTRTLAFQVDEELFQRVKAYLAEHKGANGRPLSQKDFVIGLIEQELTRWETQGAGDQPEVGSEEWERRHWNPLTGTYGSGNDTPSSPDIQGEGEQAAEGDGEDGQGTRDAREDVQATEGGDEDAQAAEDGDEDSRPIEDEENGDSLKDWDAGE